MKTMNLVSVASCMILIFFIASCKKSENEIRLAIEQQLQLYPESTLQDIYKSFFQDEYGPGHLLHNTVAARNYFERELSQMVSQGNYRPEPCGRGKNFVRAPLDLVKDGLIPADAYFSAFMAGATEFREPDIESWRENWGKILHAIEKMDLQLMNYEKDKRMLSEMLAEGKTMVHHSSRYGEKYRPHYRIMTRAAWEKLSMEINLNDKTSEKTTTTGE